MKICFFIMVLAIQAITSEKAVSKLRKKRIHSKNNVFCKKMKYENIEKPQCVKMRRHDVGLTFYIIAANKCEMEYLKCRDDAEGTVVSMKFCSHNAGLITGKQTNEKGKAHIRVKRRAIRLRSSIKPLLREAVKEEVNTTKPQSTAMQFGRINHPIKDPWDATMWEKIPQDLLIYLVM